MKIVAAEADAEAYQETTAAAVVRVVDSGNQKSFTNAEVAATVIQVHLVVVQAILLQVVAVGLLAILHILVKLEEELELQ